MADLGIARMNNEADANGTLTRADLADVAHHKLGLSRAESASVVQRGSVGPKRATALMPKAAAICRGPVSFVNMNTERRTIAFRAPMVIPRSGRHATG